MPACLDSHRIERVHLETVQKLLESRTGLGFQALGASLVECAVARRMAAHDLNDERDYTALLQRSHNEFQQLVEEVAVPETWFFRDQGPFAYLGEHARHVIGGDGRGRLNVLSAACSSGEEPYSIAMCLLDAGLASCQFHIDAVDISGRVLAAAQRGVYSRNSFRSADLAFRERYFTAQGDHYSLADHVKAGVRFLQGNIMNLGFLRAHGPYHIVFCRNVLIYFDADNKARVLDELHALLREDGLLFVGHADTGRLVEDRFAPVREPSTFAYRKGAVAEQAVSRTPQATSKKRQSKPGATTALPQRQAAKPSTRPSLPNPSIPTFENIQQQANRGELDQAALLCADYLDVHPTSVQAHCLLGTIHLAQGDNDAAQACFRKAVYLDPGHYESLTHLAGLAEQAGDDKAARNYRERAGRAMAGAHTNQP